MDFTLRFWTKPGKPERVYLNDYPPGPAHVERSGAGLRVSAPPGVTAERVLADLKARFGLAEATWEAIAGAATAPRTGPARAPSRLPRPAAGQGAMDEALLAVALAGRPLASPTEVLASPDLPEAAAAMLGRVRNLTLSRVAPPLCDVALPDRIAFVLSDWAAVAADPDGALAAALGRDDRYAGSFLVLSGDLAALGDGVARAGIALAGIVAQTRTVPVTALSPAHAGFLVACHLREALA